MATAPAKSGVPAKPATASTGAAVVVNRPQTPMPIPSKAPTIQPLKPATTQVVRPVAPAAAQQALKPAAPKGPAFKISAVPDRTRYLKCLIYGDYGIGKTRLAATSAAVDQMCNVLMISIESGDQTLLDDPEYNFDEIDVVEVKNYNVLGHVLDFLKMHVRLRDQEGPEIDQKLREVEAALKGCKPEDIGVPRRYYTVILDSLTEAEQYCMNQLLGITDLTRIDFEAATAEWAEYKKQHSMVQRLVRNFRDLPMHVIMTCSRSWTQDERKRFQYGPQMTGKLAGQVQGFMDVVGYLVTLPPVDEEGGKDKRLPRRLWIQPVSNWAAKSRFANYKGNYFDDPSFPKILKSVGLLDAS